MERRDESDSLNAIVTVVYTNNSASTQQKIEKKTTYKAPPLQHRLRQTPHHRLRPLLRQIRAPLPEHQTPHIHLPQTRSKRPSALRVPFPVGGGGIEPGVDGDVEQVERAAGEGDGVEDGADGGVRGARDEGAYARCERFGAWGGSRGSEDLGEEVGGAGAVDADGVVQQRGADAVQRARDEQRARAPLRL